MPRKGENIRKRKDGRWEGRFKNGVKADGSVRYGSVYGKTYKEVKEKLSYAKHTNEGMSVTNNADRRFSEVLYLWEQSNRVRLKGGTEQRYDYLIKTHILPELGSLKLSKISATTVNSFLNKKLNSGRINGKGGLSAAYVSSIMIIVSSALSFAVAEQMCPPLRTPIFKPQAEKKDLEILSFEDQATLEQYARANPSPTSIGILISLYMGLRIGEVCALSWEDVDLSNGVLHVRHTVARVKNESKDMVAKTRLIIDEPKTKASKRDIPIPSTLLPVLAEYRKNSETKWLASEKGTFISPRTYEYRYHQVLNICGVAHINYHALRHTFASRCVAVGVDIKSLSELLGHGNSAITLNTYVHSSMEQKQNQLEKLVSPVAC